MKISSIHTDKFNKYIQPSHLIGYARMAGQQLAIPADGKLSRAYEAVGMAGQSKISSR